MSSKDPDIVVLSSKPSLCPAGTNPIRAVLSCQKKINSIFQRDLESQKKLLRHYSYDVVASSWSTPDKNIRPAAWRNRNLRPKQRIAELHCAQTRNHALF